MTPGYDGWKDTNLISGIRPCVTVFDPNSSSNEDTTQIYYYENKEDMSIEPSIPTALAPDPSAGAFSNIMIEFPLMGYKLWNDDSYQYISVTDDPNAKDKGYCYYAHSLNTEKDCDKIYIGAFLGSTDNNGGYLQSLKNANVTTSISLSMFRSITGENSYNYNKTNANYSLISFFPWTLLQCLYVIIYKNLNSQAALGQGYTNASAVDVTGTTLSQPFCYGDPNDGTKHVKFLGIEDFYGNLYSWLDGVYADTSDLFTDYRNNQMINDGHDFQFNAGQIDNNFGYISKILGNNTGSFVPVETNGNSSTYFSDSGGAYSGDFGCCGGHWSRGALAGAFFFSLGYSASASISNIGSRLMYKHLASSGGGSNS